MKRKLFSKFISCVAVASCVLTASASIYTPGDYMLATQPGREYPLLGVFGWYQPGASPIDPFDPSTLDPLQWLYTLTTPSEVTDKTTNTLNGVMVDSMCATFDGVADDVNFGPSLVLPVSGWTASCWASTIQQSGVNGIIIKGGYTGSLLNNEGGFGFYKSTVGPYFTLQVRYKTDAGEHVVVDVASTIIADGNAHFVTFGYDGAKPWIKVDDESIVNGSDIAVPTFENTMDLECGTGGATQHSKGGLCGVEFKDLAGNVIWSPTFCEGSGLTAHDTSTNGIDGTITVGSGGEDTFWGDTQPYYHYTALHGGSMVLVQDVNNAVVAGSGLTLDAGTKSLSVTVIPTVAANQDVFTCNGKSLTLEYISGTIFQFIYDGVSVSGFFELGEVATCTTDIDVGGTSISIGGTSSNPGLVISSVSLEGSGEWKTANYDRDNKVLPDSSGNGNHLTFVNDLVVRQYPALADGTDDVAGLGITNPTAGVHNNCIYGVVQENAGVPAVFNGTTSVIECGNYGSTQNPMVEAWFKVDSVGGNQFIIARRDAASNYEYALYASTAGMAFYAADNGTSPYSALINSALTAGTWYQGQGWYNRSAGTVVARFRANGKGEWTTATKTSVPALTITSASNLSIGAVSGGASGNFGGSIGAVLISDYSTGEILNRYKMWDITGTNVPDSVGSATGVATDVTLSGTSPTAGGLLSNNPFFSANGITFDTLTAPDYYNRTNWVDNVVVSAPSLSEVNEVFSWEQDYEWTATAYDGMISYLAASNSTVPNLSPLIDSGDEYLIDSNDYLIFPAP